MRKAFLLIFSLLFVLACSKNYDDCYSIFPGTPEVYVVLMDSEGNSLLGENNVYKPSEISLLRGEEKMDNLSFQEYSGGIIVMVLNYRQMEAEVDYELKLNEEESDIINIKKSDQDIQCLTNVKLLEEFWVNGEQILIKDNRWYVIQK